MSLDLSVETRLRKKHGSIKVSGDANEELRTNQVYQNANALLAMLTDLIAARSHNQGGDSRNFTQYNFQVLRADVFMLGRDGTVTGNRIAPVRSSSCAGSSQNQNPNGSIRSSSPFRPKATLIRMRNLCCVFGRVF